MRQKQRKDLPFTEQKEKKCSYDGIQQKFSIKYGKDKLFPHFIFYTVSSFQAYTLNLHAQKTVICYTASDQHMLLKNTFKKDNYLEA